MSSDGVFVLSMAVIAITMLMIILVCELED